LTNYKSEEKLNDVEHEDLETNFMNHGVKHLLGERGKLDVQRFSVNKNIIFFGDINIILKLNDYLYVDVYQHRKFGDPMYGTVDIGVAP
jgi:hypothetical protein